MQRSLVVVGINSCSKLSDFNLRNSLRSTIYTLREMQFTESEKQSLQTQRNTVYRLREIQFTESEKYSLQNHRNTVYRIREIQNGKITIYPQSASYKSHQPKYQKKHRIQNYHKQYSQYKIYHRDIFKNRQHLFSFHLYPVCSSSAYNVYSTMFSQV